MLSKNTFNMVFLSVKSYSSKQIPLMHGKIPIYEVSNKKKNLLATGMHTIVHGVDSWRPASTCVQTKSYVTNELVENT